MVVWGLNFVFLKAPIEELDVLAFTFLRFAGMVVLGWAVVLAHDAIARRRHRASYRVALDRGDWARLVVAAVLGYALFMLLSLYGVDYTTAFSNALLVGTTPLFTAVLVTASRLESVSRYAWTGLVLSFVGVLVFVLDKLLAGRVTAGFGDVLSLSAALFFAAYTVVNKHLLERYPPAVLTAYGLTIGAVPVLVLSFPSLLSQPWDEVTWVGWGGLVWAIVFPVYVAWTVWSWAGARLGVAHVSRYMFLVPAVSGAASWWLLDERFGPLKLTGAVVVVAGLAVARRSNAAARAVAAAAPAPAIAHTPPERT